MRRLVLLVIALASAALVFWVGCGLTGGRPYSTDAALAVADRGDAIVRAAYDFHHRTGLWPADLAELGPASDEAGGPADWQVTSWYDGSWNLEYTGPFHGGTIQFHHEAAGPAQWLVIWGNSERGPAGADPLPRAAPGPAGVLIPAAEREANALAAIRGRTERLPGHLVHHKGLVSRLFRAGRFPEARVACRACLAGWPDHWWPNLVLGLIDLRLGFADESERRLAAWADRHGDFHHHYFVAHFYASAGREADARSALRRAAGSPTRDDWDGHGYEQTRETWAWGDAEFVHDAALIAYHLGDLDLCLAICDRWEELVGRQGTGDCGYPVLRAACWVNQGRFADADGALRAAAAGNKYSSCIGEHVERVRRAVAARDAKFKYDPVATGEYRPGIPRDFLIEYQ